MRIAVMGAGNVGGALGSAFARAGHDVMFGVRDPDSEKCRAAVSAAPGSAAISPPEAVARADTVIFALRWDGWGYLAYGTFRQPKASAAART
jgi:8-hydroxy-5-deazaflavin:NADPH oxidoreductase